LGKPMKCQPAESADADPVGDPSGPGSGSVTSSSMAGQAQSLSRDVVVPNRQGLHARPVMRFVDLANQFQSSISVCKDQQVVDGKSPMEMILLEATQGTMLKLVVKGPDASAATEALVKLVESGFDED